MTTCFGIDEGRNLLITGVTGAGKSYIANALSIAAIKLFKTVEYIRANTLMNEMDNARIKGTYLDYVKNITQLDMLYSVSCVLKLSMSHVCAQVWHFRIDI